MVQNIPFSKNADGKFQASFPGGTGIVQVDRMATPTLSSVTVYLGIEGMKPVRYMFSTDASLQFELSGIPTEVSVIIISDTAVEACKFVYND